VFGKGSGFVAVQSAVGKGTAVHLYFPKAEEAPNVSHPSVKVTMSAEQAPLGDGERILAVEDNDRVREATVRRLEALGYTVLEAGEQVALVFSDIVMPGRMTGYDVAEWVRSMKPSLKVLLTSGYSDLPPRGKRGRPRDPIA
jgi:hypothetical protein